MLNQFTVNDFRQYMIREREKINKKSSKRLLREQPFYKTSIEKPYIKPLKDTIKAYFC